MTGSGRAYLVKQGLHNLRANKLMTVASVGVLCACLLITGAAALLSANVNSFVDYLGDQNEVVAFLDDSVTEESTSALALTIKTNENVEKSVYISKEAALAEEMENLGDYADLLAGYSGEDNPLPASFRVTVQDLTRLDETVSFLESQSGVYAVKTAAKLVSALLALKRTVSWVGWGVVGALSLVSLVVIANTIRLTVFARRREINIMKYVGATNAFIRLPFVVEGVSIGLLAAVIAFVAVAGGYAFLVSGMVPGGSSWYYEVAGAILPFKTVVLPLALGFLGSGAVLGGVGSAVSITKYLQV